MALTLNDLAYAYFSGQAGVPNGVTLTDAEIAFLDSVVANLPNGSLADLERAYYVQQLNGGGGGTPQPTWGPVAITGQWKSSGTPIDPGLASTTGTVIRVGDEVTIEVTATKTSDAPFNALFFGDPLPEQFAPIGGDLLFDATVSLSPSGDLQVVQSGGSDILLFVSNMASGTEDATGTHRYLATPTSVPPN